jgi:hypothetical protein
MHGAFREAKTQGLVRIKVVNQAHPMERRAACMTSS